jgi:hypothetical protein
MPTIHCRRVVRAGAWSPQRRQRVSLARARLEPLQALRRGYYAAAEYHRRPRFQLSNLSIVIFLGNRSSAPACGLLDYRGERHANLAENRHSRQMAHGERIRRQLTAVAAPVGLSQWQDSSQRVGKRVEYGLSGLPQPRRCPSSGCRLPVRWETETKIYAETKPAPLLAERRR